MGKVKLKNQNKIFKKGLPTDFIYFKNNLPFSDSMSRRMVIILAKFCSNLLNLCFN